MSDARGPGDRPIGWWVKAADAALDDAFDSALAGSGVDRRAWQLLTSLARGPVTADELLARLAPFDPPDALGSALAAVRDRGWVEDVDGMLTLTAGGVAQERALASRVQAVRDAVTAALPGDDYATLVRLLGRVVDGLRGSAAAPAPQPGP